jgi:XTP/dITP diphosphohydrolase
MAKGQKSDPDGQSRLPKGRCRCTAASGFRIQNNGAPRCREVNVNTSIPIVLATRNAGKTREIQGLLQGFAVEIKNLDDFGPIPLIEEDGATFDENAYKKASLTARYLGLPALADDSGLLVDALGGAPGVLSARYAGPDATDAQRCQKLLEVLADTENRKAAFECVLSLAVPTGPALTYEGRCEGVIARVPAGDNGFGYDPIFFYPALNKTFAQLNLAEKGRISHRGKALAELRAEFDRVLIWIRQHMPDAAPIGCMGSQTNR